MKEETSNFQRLAIGGLFEKILVTIHFVKGLSNFPPVRYARNCLFLLESPINV